MLELVDGLVQSAQQEGMELYGVHVYRRGAEPVEAPDLAADFFATPLKHEPGTHFNYTGTGPYVAARALRAATGASVRDYLMPRVFTPLAIQNPQWHTCPLGHPVAESDHL